MSSQTPSEERTTSSKTPFREPEEPVYDGPGLLFIEVNDLKGRYEDDLYRRKRKPKNKEPTTLHLEDPSLPEDLVFREERDTKNSSLSEHNENISTEDYHESEEPRKMLEQRLKIMKEDCYKMRSNDSPSEGEYYFILYPFGKFQLW